MKDIYVVKLKAFRSSIGHDVSAWTHAADNIEVLQKFVQDILYPSDCGRIYLMELSFEKFVKRKDDGLFQWRKEWASSEIDYDRKNSNEPIGSYFSFFTINHAIDGLKYASDQKRVENEKIFNEAFEALWSHVNETLEVGRVESENYMDDQQEINFEEKQ